MLADYAVALGHPDPAVHLRGSFQTEDDIVKIVRLNGGSTFVVDECAKRIGAEVIDRPRLGAIGVIGSARSPMSQFGAIFDGHHWIIRFKDRVGPMVARPLKIWSLETGEMAHQLHS